MEFQSTDDKPTRRKAPAGKISANDLEGLVAAAFWMYGQTRPEHLRGAWEYAPSECKGVAEPAARIIAKLPAKALNQVSGALDPMALGIGLFAMISASQAKEKQANDALAAFLAANPEAAAQFQAEQQRRQQRGRIKRAQTNDYARNGNNGAGAGQQSGTGQGNGGNGLKADTDLPFTSD